MWTTYLWVFLVGGFICLLGQILVIRTKITSSRILVLFMVIGMILQALNLYAPIYDLAKCGISVPIIGFGASLAKGAMEGAREYGIIGALMGGLKATSAGISGAIVFSYLFALIFHSRTKKLGK
jgi:stage V sporulation protein AE